MVHWAEGDRFPGSCQGSTAACGFGPRIGVQPQLVLMDEPGALDKQLREHMQLS